MRGRAGMGVSAGCGTRVFRRAVAVYLLFPAMLAGAWLSRGTVLSVSGIGYQVREVTRCHR